MYVHKCTSKYNTAYTNAVHTHTHPQMTGVKLGSPVGSSGWFLHPGWRFLCSTWLGAHWGPTRWENSQEWHQNEGHVWIWLQVHFHSKTAKHIYTTQSWSNYLQLQHMATHTQQYTHADTQRQTLRCWPGAHYDHVSWEMLAIGHLHYVPNCHLVAKVQHYDSRAGENAMRTRN